MTTLLVAKQVVMGLYRKYEIYITPLLKFILALVTIALINARLGYMEGICKVAIVLIVALMCSFMPAGFIVVVAAAFVLLHLYTFSMECAAIIGVGFLLMFLLYFRFSPKDTLVVVLTPICFLLHVPYAVPVAMGLIGTPVSAISIGCGVAAYYMIHYVTENATVIGAMAEEETAARFKYIIDGLLHNTEMLVTIVAFAATVILVYFIRRLRMDYAWTVAAAAGSVMNIIILLVGDLIYETNLSLVGVVTGNIIAFLITLVLQFFLFNVDYSRTEKVQFEDDEYYYYVKAVPKVTVTRPEKRVKQINSQKAKTAARNKASHR